MKEGDRKPILDTQGNPLTRERIEEVYKELFSEGMKPLLEKCEWEEGGQIYHTWKINAGKHESGRQVTGYTNDAGAAQINQALKDWVNKEYGTTEENTNEER